VVAEPLRARAGRLLPIYLLLLPGLLLFATWAAYPIARSFVMSFTDWRLMGESSFVGLDNYVRALRDPAFHRALVTTVGYTAVTVSGQLLLGLAAALLLNERIRGRAAFRLVYYLPVISSWVIVSLIFVWLYNGQAGILNWLLHDVLGIVERDTAWLAEPTTAIWAIAVLGTWKGIGWTMVVFLAGLQTVPDAGLDPPSES
jgi:multiple sugar transport system permease protein